MIINTAHHNEKLTLALEGRLDTTTAPQLQDVLIPALDEAKEIELNFSQLTYVSSAGLRVLLMGEKIAKTKGVKMALTRVSPDIMEVFSMTGFDGILHIAQDE